GAQFLHPLPAPSDRPSIPLLKTHASARAASLATYKTPLASRFSPPENPSLQSIPAAQSPPDLRQLPKFPLAIPTMSHPPQSEHFESSKLCPRRPSAESPLPLDAAPLPAAVSIRRLQAATCAPREKSASSTTIPVLRPRPPPSPNRRLKFASRD